MSSLDDKGAGVDDERRYPGEGDWVLVWGQIQAGQTHPEDVIVEFFSHMEQYECHVKTDRIVINDRDELPDFAQECTDLFEYKPDKLIRCILHHDHGQPHRDRKGRTWVDEESYGYVEVRT